MCSKLIKGPLYMRVLGFLSVVSSSKMQYVLYFSLTAKGSIYIPGFMEHDVKHHEK